MAVALDGTTKSGTQTFGSSVDTGATVSTAGTNRLVVAFLSYFGVGTTGVVSGGGLTWAKLVSAIPTAADFRAEIWVAWATTAITNQTITGSWTGNTAGLIDVQAWSGSRDYTGLTAGVDYGTATGIGASGTSSVTNLTTLKNGSWAIGGTTTYGTVPTAATNCTQLASGNTGTLTSSLEEWTASPVNIGTYAIGSTFASIEWNIALIEIVPAVASGRIARANSLEGLGGAGQKAFNPSLGV